MKIYLAGQCPYPEALAHAEAIHGRFLHSYAYMRRKKIDDLKKAWKGKDIMVDSGGFSVRISGGSISVMEYREFLKRMSGYYTSCLNLDTKSVPETLRNQTFLEGREEMDVLPVYHLSDWRSPDHRHLLQQYIDEGYTYICLGGVAGTVNLRSLYRGYYDFCFRTAGKNVRLHGLGVTSVTTMGHYPFYSCDSKTWLVSGLYGDFITTKNARYKRTPKKRDSISHYGVMLPGPEKMKRAVDAFHKLERHLTAIWAKRGYVWT